MKHCYLTLVTGNFKLRFSFLNLKHYLFLLPSHLSSSHLLISHLLIFSSLIFSSLISHLFNLLLIASFIFQGTWHYTVLSNAKIYIKNNTMQYLVLIFFHFFSLYFAICSNTMIYEIKKNEKKWKKVIYLGDYWEMRWVGWVSWVGE